MNEEYFEKYRKELAHMNSLTAEAKRINDQSIQLKSNAMLILSSAKKKVLEINHMRKIITRSIETGGDPMQIALSDVIPSSDNNDFNFQPEPISLWSEINNLEDELNRSQEYVYRNQGYNVDPFSTQGQLDFRKSK